MFAQVGSVPDTFGPFNSMTMGYYPSTTEFIKCWSDERIWQAFPLRVDATKGGFVHNWMARRPRRAGPSRITPRRRRWASASSSAALPAARAGSREPSSGDSVIHVLRPYGDTRSNTDSNTPS